MQSYYLFVHFKEKSTPDGEQVYFGLSRDGFHWEAVNGGNPVLWCYYGDKGARDFTVTYCENTGKYVILGTDLCLAYGMRSQYHNNWGEIAVNGSHSFSMWESEDLLQWSEQRLIKFGREDFGCMWAPDVIRDTKTGEYLVHWSSPTKADGYREMAIYGCWTRDFVTFTEPKLIYSRPGYSVIDSAIYEEGGIYYMFAKRDSRDARIIMLSSTEIDGGYTPVPGFDEDSNPIGKGGYEAPTALKLDDGRWVLFLDFYHAHGAQQGYRPYITDSLAGGHFTPADGEFTFPYRFKHGTVMKVTKEQYEAVKAFDYSGAVEAGY